MFNVPPSTISPASSAALEEAATSAATSAAAVGHHHYISGIARPTQTFYMNIQNLGSLHS